MAEAQSTTHWKAYRCNNCGKTARFALPSCECCGGTVVLAGDLECAWCQSTDTTRLPEHDVIAEGA